MTAQIAQTARTAVECCKCYGSIEAGEPRITHTEINRRTNFKRGNCALPNRTVYAHAHDCIKARDDARCKAGVLALLESNPALNTPEARAALAKAGAL